MKIKTTSLNEPEIKTVCDQDIDIIHIGLTIKQLIELENQLTKEIGETNREKVFKILKNNFNIDIRLDSTISLHW